MLERCHLSILSVILHFQIHYSHDHAQVPFHALDSSMLTLSFSLSSSSLFFLFSHIRVFAYSYSLSSSTLTSFLSLMCLVNLTPNLPSTQPATKPSHQPSRHLVIDQPSQVRATGRGHRSQPQIPSILLNHFGPSVRQALLVLTCPPNSSRHALLWMRRRWGRRTRILHSCSTGASKQSRR